MSLRILIVGRGDAPSQHLPNGHTIEFKPNAISGDGHLLLENFDFVFQHLSPANPESEEAIKDWTNRGWKSKIIGFSGGRVPAALTKLPIPQLEYLSGRQSIINLGWSAVPVSFSGDAQEIVALLKPRKVELLPALAILCQGYLAVHAAYVGPSAADWSAEEISPALDQMGWSKLASGIADGQPLIRPDIGSEKDRVRERSWWLGIFDLLDDRKQLKPDLWLAFKDSLSQECAKGSKSGLPDGLSNLINTLEAGDGSVAPPVIVARAYSAIGQQLSRA
jgi:hypothetical protein